MDIFNKKANYFFAKSWRVKHLLLWMSNKAQTIRKPTQKLI